MKKLHTKEAQEIRLFEEEATAKLSAAEQKLQSQFTKEELKAVRVCFPVCLRVCLLACLLHMYVKRT
jgi:hypothetical protein